MTEALLKLPLDIAPLPPSVDELSENFHELEEELAEAKRELEIARKLVTDRELELIELVRRHGGPHAQKSKILHGIIWEIVATFGQHTTLDSTAVERFRHELVMRKKTRLLKKLFTQDVRWTLNAGAAQIAQAEKLQPKLLALLLQCSVTQDRKPSLDVRPKKKAAVGEK